jgi:hypothetical protein
MNANPPFSFLLFIHQVKFYLYMFNAVVDDVETQRRGVVFVIWPGPTNDLQMFFPHPRESATGGKVFACCPMRVCAIHFCVRDGPIARFIRASLTLMVGRENRSRLIFGSGKVYHWLILGKMLLFCRLQYPNIMDLILLSVLSRFWFVGFGFPQGEGIEILYKLMGYGIPGTCCKIVGGHCFCMICITGITMALSFCICVFVRLLRMCSGPPSSDRHWKRQNKASYAMDQSSKSHRRRDCQDWLNYYN